MAISFEAARALAMAAAAPLETEQVAVGQADGRVLAGSLAALVDSPPHANSAMDGFAVTAGPAGRRLRLIGESRAGRPARDGLAVDPGTTIRIATGAVLPAGAEAVVALEKASVDRGQVTVEEASAAGRNVRFAGEDIRAGQTVLSAGVRLGAVELAVAIGAGHGILSCHRRPRVVVLGTGDELRDPGSRLAPGQIHDSNTIALAALARDAGATVRRHERIRDDARAIGLALVDALADADLLILSGGVSVGPHDHVKEALLGLGAEQAFWGIGIRPGRPTWFGRRGATLILGLPGNPVSAMVIFMLLGRPLLDGLQGIPVTRRPAERASLAAGLPSHPQRTEAVAVRLTDVRGQGLTAVPSRSPDAHVTTSLIGIDALALIPAGLGGLPAGSLVEVVRL